MKSPGAPIVLSFCSESAVLLRAAAARHAVSPEKMARALVTAAIGDGLEDALLDGSHPDEIAPTAGRGGKGLTYLRCAVLYLAALHAGADGVCRKRPRELAEMASSKADAVGEAARFMARRGLLTIVEGQGLALTPAGKRLARALGDLDFDAGGRA